MHISDFYASMKERTTDAAELDAAEWHKPHTALIAELAQLHTMPATKAVRDRIEAIEADLNGWRDDYVHDLMVAYSNEGDDDAWENAEAETPSIESLIEDWWVARIEEEDRAEELAANGQFGVGA